jgi:GrpB-like predicted nucleotidyltransferase (UPF0157 family)
VIQMIGLPKGQVFLVDWTEEWEQEFLREKSQIESKIHDLIVAVHHIGSTAVKHLRSKPIIDIAIEIENFEMGLLCVEGLESIGYRYRGTNVLPDRHYFSKGEPRTHQIHMYQTGSVYLNQQLAFRDYLNTNDTARKEYEALKEKLSKQYPTDKFAYADAKSEFVTSVLQKLGLK